MKQSHTSTLAALAILAALPLAIHNVYGSIDDAIHHDANANAPMITEAEFAKGSQIFFSSAAQVVMVCCAKARPANR